MDSGGGGASLQRGIPYGRYTRLGQKRQRRTVHHWTGDTLFHSDQNLKVAPFHLAQLQENFYVSSYTR